MMKKALAYSACLHLATAAILSAQHTGATVSPNVVMVEWVESKLEPALVATAPRTASPAATESQTENAAQPIAESAVASANVSEGPEAIARRLSAEDAYLAAVKRELDRHKSYHPIAKRLGQTGRVTLRFKLSAEGRVLESRLVTPSPYEALNESALATLAAVRAFQPIPADLGQPSWEITVPIDFRLE
jgi:periplasmic protein TonB